MKKVKIMGLAALGLTMVGMSGAANAVPIGSSATLTQNVTQFGQVVSGGNTFFNFSGSTGDLITLTVNRLEADYDPIFELFEGAGSDTDALTLLTTADDNISELPGFEGSFSDPQIVDFALTSTGSYTVRVFAPFSTSADGTNDFQITLGTPPTEQVVFGAPVPEPGTLALLGAGLLGLGAMARRRRKVA